MQISNVQIGDGGRKDLDDKTRKNIIEASMGNKIKEEKELITEEVSEVERKIMEVNDAGTKEYNQGDLLGQVFKNKEENQVYEKKVDELKTKYIKEKKIDMDIIGGILDS